MEATDRIKQKRGGKLDDSEMGLGVWKGGRREPTPGGINNPKPNHGDSKKKKRNWREETQRQVKRLDTECARIVPYSIARNTPSLRTGHTTEGGKGNPLGGG